MGDGINDSPSLINSDVGISVDTAVDIAKDIGMEIICITADKDSPLARISDHVLSSYEELPLFNESKEPLSHLACMAIGDALLYAIKIYLMDKDTHPNSNIKKRTDDMEMFLSSTKL